MSGQSLPRLGDYLLIERVGEGGMAEVFRAQYSGDEHSVGPMSVVVVKRIKPELFNKPEFPIFREMFLNEAKLVRSLQHPNLARVYALLEAVDPDLQKKIPFIVQEFVRGHQLWELLRIATRGFTGVGVPAGIASFVAREMARGLGHAHSHKDAATGKLQPIIHRDISPENVMVSTEGSIKVIDFGVAKALGGFGPQTRTGIIKGKLAYMAPEQVAQKVVPATDVFGVGIVLHEMLTGRRLFGGSNDFIVISRVLKAEIPRPSQLIASIPSELDEVVMTALSRDLKVRYVDGNALADALTRAMAKLPAIKGTTESTVKAWVKHVIAEGQKISSNWSEEESGVHVDVDVADAMRRVEGSDDGIIELTADDLMKTDLSGPIDPGVRAAVTMGLKTLRPDMLNKATSRPSLAPVSAQALLGSSAADALGVALPGVNRSGVRPAAAAAPAATPTAAAKSRPTPPPQPPVAGNRTPPPQPPVAGNRTPPPQPLVAGKLTPPTGSGRVSGPNQMPPDSGSIAPAAGSAPPDSPAKSSASPSSAAAPPAKGPAPESRPMRAPQPTPLAGYAKIETGPDAPPNAGFFPAAAPRSASVENPIVPIIEPAAPRLPAPQPPTKAAAATPAFFDKQVEIWVKLIAALAVLALVLVAILIFRD